MKRIKIRSGDYEFIARLEQERSPESCRWLLSMLPWTDEAIHVSWSGFACWISLENKAHSVPFENPVHFPSPGEVILYPGNLPNMQMGGELYFAWGANAFSCCNGNLMGNVVMTIEEGLDRLAEFGNKVHMEGRQTVTLTCIE